MACVACAAVFPMGLHAQDSGKLKGQVVNSTGQPVPRATVSLRDSAKGAPWAFAVTSDSGYFVLRLKNGKTGPVLISTEHLSYQPSLSTITLPDAGDVPLHIELKERAKEMKEIFIRASPPPFQQRGDTTDFRASAYRTEETTKVEDMLKRVPGMQVGQDGRLSFNGKEVEAVMIEGENLTEQHYQVLTRNLNAAMVNRIQVVQHFQENRLMRDVSASDKVGINLTIDTAFKGRVSGSADLAVGTRDRRQADLNLVYLRQKIKWIQFLQHNNIGLSPNAGMDYQFDSEGGGRKEYTGARENGLLSAGTLYPPNLAPSYVNNNKDYSGYAIASWKTGRSVHMKVMLSGADSRLTLQSEGEQRVFQPDGFSWQNFFLDRSFQRHRQLGIRYHLRHDAGRRNLGSLWIDMQRATPQQKYLNLLSGAVTDSLKEQLDGQSVLINLRAEESIKLHKDRLLRVGIRVSIHRPTQEMEIQTSRFAEYFKLDSMQYLYRQSVRPRTGSAMADASVWGRKQKKEYSYGLKAFYLLHQVEASSKLQGSGDLDDSLLSRGQTVMEQSYARVFGQMVWYTGRKTQWIYGGYLGLGKGRLGGVKSLERTMPIYLGSVSYVYNLSSLSALTVQVQAQREQASHPYYYPDAVLTGQATVLNGAGELAFPRNISAQVSYASNALHKGRNFFLSASWSRSDQQFSVSVDRYPAYAEQRFAALNGNSNFSVFGKFEQHVKAMKSKFSLQASSIGMRFNNLYNQVYSRVRLYNLRMQPEWVSTFDGPLNAELSYALMYSGNQVQPEDGIETRFSQWQGQGYAKLKMRANKKAYLAAQYGFYRLSPGNRFNSLDFFARWQAGKKFAFSLIGHNLLHSAAIRQRQIGPNMESIQGFGLVGRYVLIRASLSF